MSEELAHIPNTVGEKRSKLNHSVWLQGQKLSHPYTFFFFFFGHFVLYVCWSNGIRESRSSSEVKHDYSVSCVIIFRSCITTTILNTGITNNMQKLYITLLSI